MIVKETCTLAPFLHQSHIVIIMDLVFFLHAFVIKRYVLSLAKSLWLFRCKRINVWNKFQVFYLIIFNVCTRGFKCSDIIPSTFKVLLDTLPCVCFFASFARLIINLCLSYCLFIHRNTQYLCMSIQQKSYPSMFTIDVLIFREELTKEKSLFNLLCLTTFFYLKNVDCLSRRF